MNRLTCHQFSLGGLRCQGWLNGLTHWRELGISLVVVGCLLPAPVLAQNNSTTFNVTVTSPSQQQVTTLATAAVSTAIMQLRSLLRYNRYTRQAERWDVEANELAAIGAPGFGAAILGAAVVSSDLAADFGRWNGFFSVDYRFGEHERTAAVPGYDFKRAGLLAGVDYRVNPDLVLGASLGYQSYENNFTTSTGNAEMDGWNVSGFGSWYPVKSWYIDGVVRLGFSDYETQRAVNPSTGPSGTATGETEGQEYSAAVGTGYVFNHNAWTVTPTLRLNYSRASIDGYTEQSSVPGALSYGELEIKSFTSNLGANATYAISTRMGVLLPQVTFEWVHQFNDDPDGITANSGNAGTFNIPVGTRDEDFYRAAIGTTAILPRGQILYAYYETALSLQDRDIHTLTLGVRVEF